MTKPKSQKIKPVPRGEAEQVRIRRELGHDFALKQDTFGRQRLTAGTAEARRVYEVSNDGYTSTGGIVRLRNVDPLTGITSLTHKQREAGARYRDDFDLAAREGLKAMGMQERVGGGSASASVPARLLDNHAAMAAARRALVYPEITSVLDLVCGLGMSLRDVAASQKVERAIPAQLLRMGLERLVAHYGRQPARRVD